MSGQACPKHGNTMRSHSSNQDGVIWVNERCSERGCLHETPFRLAYTPIKSDVGDPEVFRARFGVWPWEVGR